MRMRPAVLICACGLSFGCRSLPASPVISPPAGAATPAETRPGAEASIARVLEDQRTLWFLDASSPAKGYVEDRYLRIHVQTPAGRSAAERSISLDAFDTLEYVWARTLHPSGDNWPLRAGDLEIVQPTDTHMMFTGHRLVRVLPERVRVGSTVEIGWRVRTTRPFDLEPWTAAGPLPVERSTLVVHVPAGWEMTWSAARDGEPAPPVTPTRTPEGALAFVRRDLPAMSDQEAEPPLSIRVGVRRALVRSETTFGSWSDLSDWYGSRIAALKAHPEQAMEAARDYHATHPELSLEAALYGFVRDRIRYVAMFSGIGGFEPHAPAQVFASGFGDCKDMSTLLVSLMRAHGVDAHPALVATRHVFDVDPGVPAAVGFNHVVVAVRGESGAWTFSDPTDKLGRYGILAPEVADRWTLIVHPGAKSLSRTPKSAPEDHQRLFELTIGAESPARLQVRLTGYEARPHLGWARLPPENLPAQFARTFVPDAPPGVVGVTSARIDKDTLTFEAELDLDPLRDERGLRLDSVLGPFVVIPTSTTVHIELDRARESVTRVRFVGAVLRTGAAEKLSFSSPSAAFSTELGSRGDDVVLERRWENHPGHLRPEEQRRLAAAAAASSQLLRAPIAVRWRGDDR